MTVQIVRQKNSRFFGPFGEPRAEIARCHAKRVAESTARTRGDLRLVQRSSMAPIDVCSKKCDRGRSDPRDSRCLTQCRWAYLRQTIDHFPGQTGDPRKHKIPRDRPGLLTPLTIDDDRLTAKVALVFEFRFDARNINRRVAEVNIEVNLAARRQL